MISIFEFDDYKAYLKALESERTQVQRGFRSRLAEALNCQNAYVSQVLNSHANFSLEQGLQVTQFLNLDEEPSRYFLLLLEYSRAGTEELKNYFLKDIQIQKKQNLNLAKKIQGSQSLSKEEQTAYYSSWLYSAIHILVTIPQFQTLGAIESALGIDSETTREVILFLVSTGLVEEKNGKILPGQTQIHLSKNSPHIRQHHANWRIMAVQSLSKNFRDDIHYSTVSSLSKKDAEALKNIFAEVIRDYTEKVKPSKEEVLYNFNLDFYSLTK
jgi:uncharacterized protein (TIGR02147 family)